MLQRSSLSALALLGLAVLTSLAPLAAAQAQEAAPPPDVYTRVYILQQLDIHEAEVLVLDQCPSGSGDGCKVRNAGPGEAGLTITLQADSATHERVARALAEHDVVPRTQVFQVTLVLADKGANGGSGEMPKAAAEALKDVRELLPFSHYSVVDSGWIRTTREAEITLAGPDGHSIEVRMLFGRRVGTQLFVERFRLVRSGVPPQAGPGGEMSPPEEPRKLVETSFSMGVGETLVVGTSKLDGGDEALLALVTAVE